MFILNSADPLPLYRQLYRQLREAILAGRLPAGARLPSVRELAAELATSRNTVDAAYQELLAEGYLCSRERSGYFVASLEAETLPPVQPRSPKRPPVSPPPVSPCRFDFHPARLDPQSFPVAHWRRCYLQALRSSGPALVQYGDPQGDEGLRFQLQRYLERSRGVVCAPEQVVVCAGLQQSLEILALLLREDHQGVAVEEPGYHLPRALFSLHGYSVEPVPVTPGGIDIDRLQSCRSSVVYVTPSHQLPLGQVMPVSQRLRLLDWAEQGARVILEDDYDSELRYAGRPIPALQGLRPQGRVVYLGTCSKVFSPALRLSYMVLPPALLPAYRQRFAAFFATVPLLEQRALATFMEEGGWERHLRRQRTRYQKKHHAMLDAIARHLGDGCKVVGQGAGLHLVLELPPGAPTEAELLERARQRGMNLHPFSAFYAGAAPEGTRLILGFGGLSPADIEAGIALLAELIGQGAA